MEEVGEKYDRLALKLRDRGKECEDLKIQGDHSEKTLEDLRSYVQELEAIIKNSTL